MRKSTKIRAVRNNSLNLRWTLLALLLCLGTGLVCNYFYVVSSQRAIDIHKFQSQLIQKEIKSAKTLDNLKQIVIHSSIDSLIHYPFQNDDISYYVFEGNDMVFWSDNHLDISKISLPDSSNVHYISLPNAYCVSKLISFETTKILALITIKNNYPYENEELINSFARGFDLDKQIQIVKGKETDKQAVHCSHGDYLFSLSGPKTPIINGTWSMMGLIAYSFAFFLFFLLYARSTSIFGIKYFKIKPFVILSTSVGLLIGLCLYFNIPTLLFWNKLFTAFQYASNPLLTSIIHLSIATGYFLCTIYLFYFHVNTSSIKSFKSRVVMQFVFVFYFAIVYYVLSGLIYHSSIQLSILHFKDFSFVTIWIHFLLLMWGIGLALLFYKTHHAFNSKRLLRSGILIDICLTLLAGITYFIFSPQDAIRIGCWFFAILLVFYLPILIPKYKNIYIFMTGWILIFTAFIVYNSLVLNDINKFNKYKILAQNISINGNTENDRMAEILLEELDLKITKDRKIRRLISVTDSLSVANGYLNATYLRGFWNKYEMRLNVAATQTDLYNEYDRFIASMGTQITNTHFYSVPANENNMSYIGAFPITLRNSDSLVFYMEFYPRRNFKSYSFPNLLIASSPNIQTQLNLAIAKYEHGKLVYSSGKTEYSISTNWIPKIKSEFFKVIYKDLVHYIYSPNASTYIVITELQHYDPIAYFLYFHYTFLSYFSICWLLIWGFLFSRQKRNYRLGLTAKFQYSFIFLLIVSFLGIFYVSVNFIQTKYQEQQIVNLENKKSYIQKALQDMYYWNQDLNALNTQNLNFDLQDLSYIYHTDIHVFNNQGVLVGSSQPLIFNKSLISNRISPMPYFTLNANLNQYEHIGKLNYLTGYSDFYNGDYLQIGFIAIPQFFSQGEIRSEIESFLVVIIHIYLIIIVLAILLSLFIGKQLSAPLNMIENKLKEMRLGQRNEKIEYSLNDEIGQLVIQYNRTVDELEQSARLLAQSERESAWKSMARQVAHEINNPLTPMKLTIQQLQRTKKMNDASFDDYFAKSTTMLVEQIDNLSRIAGTFSNFARMPEANFERVDIAARLYSVAQLFANNYEHIIMDYHGAEKDIFVYADPEQLVQVFNNLLKNAIQAIPNERSGKIQVNLQQKAQQVVIDITDNGVGILDEAHDKLFAPNFTTKTTGMGLGLAISKNIIELSGGTITFSTRLNKGTTFTVKLLKAD